MQLSITWSTVQTHENRVLQRPGLYKLVLCNYAELYYCEKYSKQCTHVNDKCSLSGKSKVDSDFTRLK